MFSTPDTPTNSGSLFSSATNPFITFAQLANVAAPAAFELRFKPRAQAQTHNRRRVERKHRRLFQTHESPENAPRHGVRAVFLPSRSDQSFRLTNIVAPVGLIQPERMSWPPMATIAVDLRLLQDEVLDLFHHLRRAVQRRALRQGCATMK